jgi:hypothetical protein
MKAAIILACLAFSMNVMAMEAKCHLGDGQWIPLARISDNTFEKDLGSGVTAKAYSYPGFSMVFHDLVIKKKAIEIANAEIWLPENAESKIGSEFDQFSSLFLNIKIKDKNIHCLYNFAKR